MWLAGSRAQAQQLWRTGPVAPWHVGSSQTRARTRIHCIGRRILNHCATREARHYDFLQVPCKESVPLSPLLPEPGKSAEAPTPPFKCNAASLLHTNPVTVVPLPLATPKDLFTPNHSPGQQQYWRLHWRGSRGRGGVAHTAQPPASPALPGCHPCLGVSASSPKQDI